MNAPKDRIAAMMQDKTFRDAMASAFTDYGIPHQIKTLRESRGWSQDELARRMGVTQPFVAAIERPGSGGRRSIKTLKRVARAFDVALVMRFESFGKLLEIIFAPDGNLYVPDFENDPGVISAG